MDMAIDTQTKDAAFGAILGALVGDASGAVLEFARRAITEIDVEKALSMPGGGVWKVAPGQITDDGELTMSLLWALAENPEQPTEAASSRYAAWYESDPFDIGTTTAAAFGRARGAREMTAAAAARSMGSMANGSLMRATPLGVWGAGRSEATTIETAMSDARLSHPNENCVGAAVAYALAIRHLIQHPGCVDGAFNAALLTPSAEVREWLAEAKRGVRAPYSPHDGFVWIAFTHAFRHLLAGTSYVEAIAETLRGGGDTDTNACIVGGLLGARWGVSAIPESMKQAVLECDPARGAHARPEELHPRHVERLVNQLLMTRA
jgi:ADP-ribosylglycohydrolase